MPAVINTVTKAAPTDNYAVVNDTDLLGSFRIVNTILERDAIVSNQRKQGMLVYVLADLHYYSLQAGLLAWTDLGTSLGGGGFAPAIVRDLYLVQDAATQTRMGGVANNVYITTQSVYNAANTLQLALGGTNRVNINVGNTLATVVGDLTLTANHNVNICWTGVSPYVSEIGNIIATNAAGGGFSIGLGVNAVRFSNMKVGNVSTNATGTTGNSGNFLIRGGSHNIFGNIDTSITNAANITGNGGTITYNVTTTAFVFFNNITTSSKATNTNAGQVTLDAQRITIGGITTAVNNSAGFIRLRNATCGNINMTNSSSTLGNSSLTLTGCTLSNIAVTIVGSIVGTPNVILKNNSISGNVSILNNGTGVTETDISENNSIVGTLTTNLAVKTTAKLSSFFKISNLGDNSTILNCVIDSSSSAGTSLNEIGTNCTIILTSINPESTSLSIDNSIPVIVTGTNSVFINGVGANVTVI